VWRKQRATVVRELAALGCGDIPLIELWNKIDAVSDPLELELEASRVPLDVEGLVIPEDDSTPSRANDAVTWSAGARKLQMGGVTGQSVGRKKGSEQRPELGSINSYWSGDDDAYVSGTPVMMPPGDIKNIRKEFSQVTFTVACSAKTGQGIGSLLDAIEKALALYQRSVSLFVPYDRDDGVIAKVFNQGTIESVEYRDNGTFIMCRLPSNMMYRVEPFIVD
jgi:hypothetical protein